MSDGSQRRPVSTAGYWVAGATFVVGAAIALVWLVASVGYLVRAPDSYTRVQVPVPGHQEVSLAAGTWILYVEHPSSVGTPAFEYAVVGPDGQVVPAEDPPWNALDYWRDRVDGEAFASFEVTTPGIHEIWTRGDGPPTVSIAVGEPIEPLLLASPLLALLVGGTAVVLATTVGVLTGVRRSSARRAGTMAPLGPPSAPPAAPPPKDPWAGR